MCGTSKGGALQPPHPLRLCPASPDRGTQGMYCPGCASLETQPGQPWAGEGDLSPAGRKWQCTQEEETRARLQLRSVCVAVVLEVVPCGTARNPFV